jgi:hypothetical protein
MHLQPATRRKVPIRCALQGPSGSGKTYSALLLAYGLCKSWNQLAVIDTEAGSSHLYSHLGPFNVLQLSAPFTPERYCEAIDACIKAGASVIILDSASHEWEYLLDYHSNLPGNSFTNWAKVTPRHNQFLQKMLHAPTHIIATLRTKQDYVLTDKNGKMVPEKVGLKSVQRDGLEYEFTLVLDLDMRNNASASKDRTGLFFGKPEFVITEQTGELIASWCDTGSDTTEAAVKLLVEGCNSLPELVALFNQYPSFQEPLRQQFEQRKRQLQATENQTSQTTQTPSQNGIANTSSHR